MLEVAQFACLQDNYGYLIHDQETGATAAIDTPEVGPLERVLAERGWTLSHILNTHHHFDHVGGNEVLKEKYQCVIVGPGHDRGRIPGLDVGVREGDEVELGATRLQVLETPGHTTSHIVYYSAADNVAFVGDTLFMLGCGRLFEGTPVQMWDSLQKILRWPDETLIYCAHEYTEANARFALSVEPENSALRARVEEINRLRAEHKPTVPATLEMEKATNPFLRPGSAELRHQVGVHADDGTADVDVFAKTRALKDQF